MIPHHEQAIEMAEIALDPTRAASPAVLELARRVQAAQDPEIEAMRGMLAAWGAQEVKDMGDDHSAHGMSGMMTADQMAALEQASGPEFDAMWLEMMIEHHEGAITMSRDEVAGGKYAPTVALAETIIVTQQAEIDTMKGLLTQPT
jgi:uncharacterized protein (DUF305 family)